MARSSYSVVAISSNSLPRSIAAPRCSINVRELSLVIYVQGKNILRKSCIHENMKFFIYEIFSVKKISELQYSVIYIISVY